MAFLDTVAGRHEGAIVLLGRLGIAALYLPSGFAKLTDLDGFAAALAAGGVPAPDVMALAGAGVEFFGSLAILLGFKARYAALVMAAFTLAATLVSHRYWEFAEAAARQEQAINFFKNGAIVGGLLFLVARGGGPLSLDRGK